MVRSSSQSVDAPDAVTDQRAAPSSGTPHEIRHSLPSEPVTIVKPSGRWIGLNLRELWRYRELIYFLTWRDVKVRYKQTAFGVAWAILQPLFTMLIFTLFFGRLAGVPSDNIPYPVFAYAGLIGWTFFANAVTNSGNSLIGSAHLITKVYFPRMSIPVASVAAGLVDLLVAFLILVPLMIYYRITPTWNILLFPVVVVVTALLAVGVGMWLSAINVKYRDVRFALPFLIQVWMFLSPVIYPASFLPARWRWLLFLNPLAGLIEGYRSSLFGLRIDWSAIALSVGFTIVILIYSTFTFRRMEKTFADIV